MDQTNNNNNKLQCSLFKLFLVKLNVDCSFRITILVKYTTCLSGLLVNSCISWSPEPKCRDLATAKNMKYVCNIAHWPLTRKNKLLKCSGADYKKKYR